jgi:hypothetical protein
MHFLNRNETVIFIHSTEPARETQRERTPFWEASRTPKKIKKTPVRNAGKENHKVAKANAAKA